MTSDRERQSEEEHRRRSPLLQMLGGAAIAVALLLPLFVLAQQANNLALAKLELELAQTKAALQSSSPVPSQSAAQPMSPPAQPAASAPGPPSETAPVTSPPSETARITRALGELTRRVEELAARTESPATAQTASPSAPLVRQNVEPPPPAAAARSEPAPAAVNLAGTKVRVRYPDQCLQVAVAVAERLIGLGVDPQLTEGSERGLRAARVAYANAEQLGPASRIADALASITSVEVVEDAKAQALEAIQLQLAGDNNCGRGVFR